MSGGSVVCGCVSACKWSLCCCDDNLISCILASVVSEYRYLGVVLESCSRCKKADRSFSARAACAQVPPITNPGPKTADCTPVLAAAFSKLMSCFQHFMELPPLTTHVCPAQRSRCGNEVAVCLVGMQLPQVHQSSTARVCSIPSSWARQVRCNLRNAGIRLPVAVGAMSHWKY